MPHLLLLPLLHQHSFTHFSFLPSFVPVSQSFTFAFSLLSTFPSLCLPFTFLSLPFRLFTFCQNLFVYLFITFLSVCYFILLFFFSYLIPLLAFTCIPQSIHSHFLPLHFPLLPPIFLLPHSYIPPFFFPSLSSLYPPFHHLYLRIFTSTYSSHFYSSVIFLFLFIHLSFFS